MCSHFFGVIGVKHASSFILFISGMAKATALAAVSWAGAERWPVPLEYMGDTHTRLKDPSSKFYRLCLQMDVLPHMGGTLLICSLWGGGAGVFWLATRSDLASALLRPYSAPTLWRRWVWVVGHTPILIYGIRIKYYNTFLVLTITAFSNATYHVCNITDGMQPGTDDTLYFTLNAIQRCIPVFATVNTMFGVNVRDFNFTQRTKCVCVCVQNCTKESKGTCR